MTSYLLPYDRALIEFCATAHEDLLIEACGIDSDPTADAARLYIHDCIEQQRGTSWWRFDAIITNHAARELVLRDVKGWA